MKLSLGLGKTNHRHSQITFVQYSYNYIQVEVVEIHSAQCFPS